MTRTYRGYKYLAIALALVAVLTLTLSGCGSQEETQTSYFATINGVETTLTYHAKGDTVFKQTAKNRIPYTTLQVSTAEEAKELLDPASAEYQGLEGIEERIEYTEDAAIETMVVDYATADLEKLSELSGTQFEGGTKGKVSLKKSIKLLEDSGFKKVEEAAEK